MWSALQQACTTRRPPRSSHNGIVVNQSMIERCNGEPKAKSDRNARCWPVFFSLWGRQ